MKPSEGGLGSSGFRVQGLGSYKRLRNPLTRRPLNEPSTAEAPEEP